MADIETLKQQRARLIKSIALIQNFINNFREGDSKHGLILRKKKLVEILQSLEENQTELDVRCPGTYSKEYEELFDLHFELSAQIEDILETNINENKPNIDLKHRQINIKLPDINLPKFNGNYSEWNAFIDIYNSLIHNNEHLSDVQKLHYLKGTLQSPASDLITNLSMTNENYNTAYNLLQDRYNNKYLIITSHLQSLNDIKPILRGSHENLQSFLNQARQQTQSLVTIHEDAVYWDIILVFQLTNKLDHHTRLAWSLSQQEGELPTLNKFYKFLETRSCALETATKTGKIEHSGAKIKSVNIVSQDNQHKPCIYCKLKGHRVYNCFKFKKLPITQRQEILRLNLHCEKCLEPAHSPDVCKFSQNCKICQKKHHTMMHVYNDNKDSTSEEKVRSSETTQKVLFSQESNSISVLLATAIINIENTRGELCEARALLDSGSQTNLVTKDLAERLQLPQFNSRNTLSVLQGKSLGVSKSTKIKINSINSSYSRSINCIVIDKITTNLPAQKVDASDWKIPNNIKLADPSFSNPGPVDVLIGAELFFEIIQQGSIKLGYKLPMLKNSKLGWMLSGPYKEPSMQPSYVGFISNDQLNCEITKFWQIEEIDSSPPMQGSDKICEDHFLKTVHRHENGRYEVSLPFIENRKSELGESFHLAKSRLLNLERRFKSDKNLLNKYAEFMEEYIRLGHAQETTVIQHSTQENPVYYLPHHPVIKEYGTTKLRVVFDASAKTSNNISLNDILHTGPKLQQELISILIRFRCWKYVFITDITKMYRQIKVAKKDQEVQRILWRCDPKEDIRCYKLTTVTYGTSSAPYLAIRVLNKLAEDEESSTPVAADIIKQDCYVDDIITGANSITDLHIKSDQLVTMLGRGGFSLHKWSSNNQEFLNTIAQENQELENTCFIDKTGIIKALGLLWNPTEDIFKATIPSAFQRTFTKRAILSAISQIFDPMGLIAPVVVKAKMIMQKIWKQKTDWDEEVPATIKEEWKTLQNQFTLLKEIKIQRYMFNQEPIKQIECHGFADASMAAYGACIYVRAIYNNNSISSRLLTAKSKVAPIKNVTLPRLELCAALLLARLYKHISKVINIHFDKTFMWSDSTIVLGWLKTDPSKLKMFVSNRVQEIQETTSGIIWSHVSSQDNAADIVSRGVTPQEIINNSLWWFGPTWLLSNSEWPTNKYEEVPVEDMPELKVLVIAYCLRFNLKLKYRHNKDTLTLSTRELDYAHNAIIKLAQREEFNKIIHELESNKYTGLNTSSELKGLYPFIDSEGILRVGGRIDQSDLTFSHKHPIILPKGHRITYLIIKQEHERLLHAGTQAVLMNIRRKYWPINARNQIKGIIRECIKCKRFRAEQSQQLMGSLPRDRVIRQRPFLSVGIDYAGPVLIRSSRLRKAPKTKAYIVIYICMTTKAIHLDLVTELSTKSFLASLKRFVSRRGVCSTIHSDNGTNFVGASRQLNELYKFFKLEINRKNIIECVANMGITWKFIPSHAPHFGGLWESNIKSMKHYLHRVIGSTCLTYEEYLTLLI
ncbi:uncharacterized protein LOC113365404 [Ctenocephalides felis]|uniref:uncharacterized protein LOC113365404 n=1 Tax=Ctenocephalides felis TaxID=7515 RepID=UPI000E6E139C|nr:uncharacterized protein LOC113365404 [Ctenocephalides felis]